MKERQWKYEERNEARLMYGKGETGLGGLQVDKDNFVSWRF